MEFYYEKETFAIVGAAMYVYNKLGYGFHEAVYQEALEYELLRRNIPFEREKVLPIIYDGITLKQNFRADFVCYGKIIVELKAVDQILKCHKAQVLNYLRVTGYKLGLLLNYGPNGKLHHERVVY